MNRYAIALDWCHRMADRERARDELLRLSNTRTRAKATLVQNITDVDDEIIRRARELGIDASDLARGYERAYLRKCVRCATTPWTCTRAPATTSTKWSCHEHAGQHLDAADEVVKVSETGRVRR
jgi:post-segregation antitoxin (ccd killing protein)